MLGASVCGKVRKGYLRNCMQVVVFKENLKASNLSLEYCFRIMCIHVKLNGNLAEHIPKCWLIRSFNKRWCNKYNEVPNKRDEGTRMQK